jgi:hypothetical protein
MAAKQDVLNYLRSHGSRATTSDIADATGYTTQTARKKAKELMGEGKVNGSKAKRIPAVIISDDYVVITDDRNHLLKIIQDYAPHHHSRAKSMSTKALQQFIRNQLASRTVGGPYVWEFWA